MVGSSRLGKGFPGGFTKKPSAPWVRPALPRPSARVPSRPIAVLFHGWSVPTIAEWCRVSRATARRYKTGALSPSPQARALFVLHRDGRVLTAEWDGWQVRRDAIIDPEGNETTARLVRGYMLMLAWVRSKYLDAGDYWADMDRAFGVAPPTARVRR